ncbi:MAG: NAD(P)/FAD-dependent oxidoreductase [Solimicrobium sp.]|jgi:NADH dehydrogenase|nr:NAD(P)/FAD-dependent oxidoreductase [Solimicrobium sp.]
MPTQKLKVDLHHIVIVGGGAGGLELAVRLGRKLGKTKKALITLIDSSPTHLWKPLLHQVAAGTLDSHANTREYFSLARSHHFNFRLGRLAELNRASKQLFLAAVIDENGEEVQPRLSLNFDTLIIAVGSEVNDFGTKGAREHCIMLDTPEMAERFHHNLINQCLRLQISTPGSASGTAKDGLTVTIIGGGATGVELAAELRLTTQILSSYGLVNFPAEKAFKIIIVDLANRVLSMLPERVSKAVEKELGHIAVQIYPNEKVIEVSKESVKMASGTVISSGIVVWAAGIKAPEFLAEMDGLETNRLNQLVVTRTLQTTQDSTIFALGDCAACPQGPGRPNVPPRAQAAHQQANLLARSLTRRLKGKPLLLYEYKDYGSLISIGNYSAVGNLMGSLIGRSLFVEGTIAKIMYWLLHKQHQVTVNGYFHTFLTTLTELINRVKNPRIKLH